MKAFSGLRCQAWFSRWIGVFLLSIALIIAWVPGRALAQEDVVLRSTLDSNGVDVITGRFHSSIVDVSIGQPGAGGLAYSRTTDATATSLDGSIAGEVRILGVDGGTRYTLTFAGRSASFFAATATPGTFTPEQSQGLTLSYASSAYTLYAQNGRYIYTLVNGVYKLTSVVAWSGATTWYNYRTAVYSGIPTYRLQSITNNFGYQIYFEYARSADPTNSTQNIDWLRQTRVLGINNAVDYCAPTAASCTYTTAWPFMIYAQPQSGATRIYTSTDELGRVTTHTFNNQLTNVTSPSGAQLTAVYDSSTLRVQSVSNGVGTWTYAYSDNSGVRTTTVTDPLLHQQVYTSDIANNRILSYRNAANETTTYRYGTNGLIDRITRPMNDRTDYTYDGRGNLTQVVSTPSSGSGTITTFSASYPSSPSNPATDNLPTWTRDALGQQTDYYYDSTTGQVTSVWLPDPDGGGSLPRPATGYSYTPLSAWYKDASGSVVHQTSSSISLLTNTYQCRTSQLSAYGCGGGLSDTVITTIAYGATYGFGTVNNLLATATTVASGDGSLSATTNVAYDHVGALVDVNGPLSGSADSMRYHWSNGGRQLLGMVGADPDGGDALLYRAVRYTYNLDGQPTLIEQGTATNRFDLGTFSPLQRQMIVYDGLGFERQRRLLGATGTASLSVMQTSYDGAGRVACTALRMNPVIFQASLPDSACTMTQAGEFGQDRITRYTYDNADRVTQVTEGYGSSAPINTQTRTYNANGQVLTLADGAGHPTSYAYDGYGRLTHQYYPNPSSSGSSGSDYERYTYNNAGDVLSWRRRDGQTTYNTYDNLRRQTLYDTVNDVGITYDNFGGVRTLTQSSQTYTYNYDVLGRLISEVQPMNGTNRTVGYQYNLAGQRTRITWPDNFYVQYDYDAAGAMTAIRENGASSGAGVLATYAYDNLGRRTSTTRGNGAVETRSFDAASRLAQLTQDLSGSSQDQTFNYAYSPANQIVSRGGSNAAYTHPAPSAGTTNYTSNNLNQITSGGTTYSARGNRVSHASGTLSYDLDNNLAGLGSSVAYTYDPAGRMRDSNVSGVVTRFLYDGAQMIAEYNSAGTMLRRYVPGAGMDEPVVWYEGSGTTDRRWLVADERGSVIAVTNGSAAATTINTYDEYGAPGSSNAGRFQYTGQAWLQEVGLYHYKARAYDPHTGRFLQTDPIGMADDTNVYAYVGNDPFNRRDPWGLCEEDIVIWGFMPSSQDEIIVTACPPGSICDPDAIRQLIDSMGPPLSNLGSGGSTGGAAGDDGGGEFQSAQLFRILPRLLLEPPPVVPRPTFPFPRDLTRPPQPGWQWRGRPGSEQGGREGNWVDPSTGEYLHNDMGHPPPVGPHLDWYPGTGGQVYRWFPDGTVAPKAVVPGVFEGPPEVVA